MIDLSGQVVHIVLNPAQGGTEYDSSTGILTFTDAGGNVCRVVVPPPIEHGDSGWWTCWPKVCMP